MTTTQGSPIGASNVEAFDLEHNGAACREVAKDHTDHTWANRHVDWDEVPGEGGWRVYEYEVPRDVSDDYPKQIDGRRYRVVRYDSRAHPGMGGQGWEWICDEDGKHTLTVREFMPTTRRGRTASAEPVEDDRLTPEQIAELPEWMRDTEPTTSITAPTEPTKEMAAKVEPPDRAWTLRRPKKGETDVRYKFGYSKAMRGRIGKGDGKQLTHEEHTVLMRLWDYSDPDLTNARPGWSRLVADLGYSGPSAKRTVVRYVERLEAKRFLVLTKQGGSGRTANVYRLTLPEWEPPMP